MAARLPAYLLRAPTRMLQALATRPLHSSAKKCSIDNNYQNDFDSFTLSPASASHRVYWRYQDDERGNAAPAKVFNEHMVRTDLLNLPGGNVHLEKDEETGIATITLSNPTKANAITGKMMVELADHVKDLEQWDSGKAVILMGDENSDNFCAGMDLQTATSLDDPESGTRMCIFMQNTLSRLQRLRLLSVAAIHGTAVGAGAELSTACDFRLMANGKLDGITNPPKIWFIQSVMGVTPGLGGGARLVQITGPRVALKILTGGLAINGDDAFKMGLADHLVPSSNVGLVKYTKSWMEMYTRAAPEVIWGMKHVVRAGAELPLDQALHREKDIFASLWGGPHQKEAFANAKARSKE